MHIDFEAIIFNLDGTPVKSQVDGELQPFKLKQAATIGLVSDKPGMRVEDKVKRFKLALKVQNGGIIEVSAEDVVLLKNAIGEVYSPVIVGRAHEILESPVKKEGENSSGEEKGSAS